MSGAVQGWLVATACGWALFPLLHRLLAPLPDRGYACSKAIGIALCARLAYGFVEVTGRPLQPAGACGAILLLAFIAWLARWCLDRGRPLTRDDRLGSFVIEKRRLLLSIEWLFLAGLLIFTWILSRNPAVDPDSERFMDYAFLKATLRSPGLPIADPWFAPEPMRYYHFGYVVAAFLVRAAAAQPGPFFTTLLALCYALTWTGAFGLGLALTRRLAGGFASALLVLGAGNLEWLRQAWRARGLAPFDWFQSSRAIAGGITEFPWFSMLWGDLHPYVVALPLFLAALCIPLAGQFASGAPDDRARGRRDRYGRWALFSLACGVLIATHPWDLPFFLFLAMLGAASGPPGVRLRCCLETCLAPVAGAALFWPCLYGLVGQGRSLAVAPARTSAVEWCLAYGTLLPILAIGVLGDLHGRPTSSDRPDEAASPGRSACWALIGTGLLAAVAAEAVTVQDLYAGTDLARMNTIFKFYRIAWACLAIAAGSLVVRSIVRARWRRRRLVQLLLAACLVMAIVYPVLGTASWLRAREAVHRRGAGGGQVAGEEPGADAEALFRVSRPGDAGAVAVLAARALPGETVLEETGEAYSWSSRIATFSGVPGLLGWGNHEAVWRNNWNPIQERQRAVDTIYADPDSEQSRDLIRRYRIAWVVVGDLERARYGAGLADRFTKLGVGVFEDHGTILFRLDR